ncbi:PREDICTED: PRA1 family protein 3 [Nicrophorus vespilloides]|uniref:PRA1 family protein n=1 Tax=Nicrophorus vespilloides TaxID=110193 RepID=A0ABM1M7E2_NICVS|nr:PREDICTED: PRA1 family protein 3 [Nicrophorus vespilloides]
MQSDALSFAPLRPLDDFLLDSARFQLPDVNDIEKWGKRVSNNLLYYQSNYFLMSILIIIIFTAIHPTKMITGSFLLFASFFIIYYMSRDVKLGGNLFRKNPMIISLVIFSLGYFLLSKMLGSLLVFLLGILIPICLSFIHASLRMRNIKNKIVNKTVAFKNSQTPMGIFLRDMGIEFLFSAFKEQSQVKHSKD